MTDSIRAMLEESAGVKRSLADSHADEISTFAAWMSETYRNGNKVVLFGNGGSMCDANHIAEELVGRYKRDRRPLPALALSECSFLTAVGNDFGFDTIFVRGVDAWVVPGDLVIGLTTSGGSPNVLAGLEAARKRGARTVGLTGAGGGSRMAPVCDLVIAVPSSNVPRIQECHITIGHIVCEIAEADIGEPAP